MTDDAVLSVIKGLQLIAERNSAQVDRIVRIYFSERDSMEPVSRAELLERFKNGQVAVLDVRPANEFAMGHVAGAISIPLKELEAQIANFDPAKEIVAYCRGAYCVLSFEAVALLRQKGLKARRMEDGYPEWKAAGLTIGGAVMTSVPNNDAAFRSKGLSGILCVRLVSLLTLEPFARDDGELGPCLEPFTRRPFPVVGWAAVLKLLRKPLKN